VEVGLLGNPGGQRGDHLIGPSITQRLQQPGVDLGTIKGSSGDQRGDRLTSLSFPEFSSSWTTCQRLSRAA
jgi:hypothetical protein